MNKKDGGICVTNYIQDDVQHLPESILRPIRDIINRSEAGQPVHPEDLQNMLYELPPAWLELQSQNFLTYLTDAEGTAYSLGNFKAVVARRGVGGLLLHLIGDPASPKLRRKIATGSFNHVYPWLANVLARNPSLVKKKYRPLFNNPVTSM
ncbi:hypothetical protein BD324DRAFT_268346 [Kockovaella imperatae]|uniref:Uncharacterized protein n=1 Tax=Kockovaella imperatae TaxID=4999 RepID=A0A1Y1URK2_9TREE|nr:hypothetical protein BD324DRAFT_268346 [Kockovaella imperatae]ORX40237.1 hypothetical protein BD324DRAFT_268346 [Kockovaella imperatae]